MTTTATVGTFSTNLSSMSECVITFNLSSSFVADCSDFLAARDRTTIQHAQNQRICLQSPQYGKHFLVLVVVLVVNLKFSSINSDTI